MLLALGKGFERSQAIGRFNTVIAEGRADLLCGARSIMFSVTISASNLRGDEMAEDAFDRWSEWR